MKQLVLILLFIAVTHKTEAYVYPYNLPEDTWLDFTQLAQKYGQKTEEFDIPSNGGYILKLFHLIGNRNKPILFIHGALDTADSFITRGNTSLMIALSKENYDMWAINLRGNRYSRKHTTMNPDTDKEYWDFSVHEYGYYDLPAAIDFILDKTGQEKVSAIGISEGTMSMFVMGATRPEYNEKINIFIALAPVCYISNFGKNMQVLIQIAPFLNRVLHQAGLEEFLGYNSQLKAIWNHICLKEIIGYELCLLNGIFLVTGADPAEIEPEFLPVIIGHFPAGTSRKNMYHLAQISASNRFQNYDYGSEKNLLKYNSTIPPEYDVRKVTMKIALFVAKNDMLSTIKDVEIWKKLMPNVVDYSVMEKDQFNHVDFVWGRTGYKYYFPRVFKLLKTYS